MDKRAWKLKHQVLKGVIDLSVFSDFAVGALSEVEFHNAYVEMNARDRWEREHEFDDPDEESEDEDCESG